ncbi:unnamed protein product [Moneuplotes crassus]|uniref:RING-type E3 ubiquitin transferase n=1 Tax=Euplotes crassus TaxID=5936 RepID=A0AAD1XPH7_EUPCR|nr:unnamed protein product [Moneuplotes crassus]
MNEIVDAQLWYGNDEDAVQRAIQMSLVTQPLPPEEAKVGDDFVNELYGVPPDQPDIIENEAPYASNHAHRLARENQIEGINIGDYDYEEVLDDAIKASERAAKRLNREGRERHNRIVRAQGHRNHRDAAQNDLLANLSGNRIRDRANNPLSDMGAQGVKLRPGVRNIRKPQRASRVVPRVANNHRRARPNYRRREDRNHGMQVDIDNMNYDQILELQNNIGSVSKGYSQEEIEAIPITYSFPEEPSNCPICLDDIESGAPILSISCRHEFHLDCLQKSLESNKECPICKEEAFVLS